MRGGPGGLRFSQLTKLIGAVELLADDHRRLVPFRDPSAIARSIDDLLSDENRRQTMRKNAYRIGRKMVVVKRGSNVC